MSYINILKKKCIYLLLEKLLEIRKIRFSNQYWKGIEMQICRILLPIHTYDETGFFFSPHDSLNKTLALKEKNVRKRRGDTAKINLTFLLARNSDDSKKQIH